MNQEPAPAEEATGRWSWGTEGNATETGLREGAWSPWEPTPRRASPLFLPRLSAHPREPQATSPSSETKGTAAGAPT